MGEPVRLLIDRAATLLGELAVVTDAAGRLRAVDWTEHAARMQRLLHRGCGLGGFTLTPGGDRHGRMAALLAYFAGDLAAIDTLPAAAPGTPFQQAVWRALRDIPAGETVSYGGLARRIGCPAAVRAVGLANGSNPVGLVVPCHRVIGADGTLTGYGGGLERKRWLLEHERWYGRPASDSERLKHAVEGYTYGISLHKGWFHDSDNRVPEQSLPGGAATEGRRIPRRRA